MHAAPIVGMCALRQIVIIDSIKQQSQHVSAMPEQKRAGKAPTVDISSATTLHNELDFGPSAAWQLRRVDYCGSHTWVRSPSSLLHPDIVPQSCNFVAGAHLQERAGFPPVEECPAGLYSKENKAAGSPVIGNASPLSEPDTPQNVPVQGQCAFVVDWLMQHGVPLNAAGSMTALDIQHGLKEPLRDDGPTGTARKLPAALVVATGAGTATLGTQLSEVVELSREATEAMRSASPTLDSPSSRASPTGVRVSPTSRCWASWTCWPWCGIVKGHRTSLAWG